MWLRKSGIMWFRNNVDLNFADWIVDTNVVKHSDCARKNLQFVIFLNRVDLNNAKSIVDTKDNDILCVSFEIWHSAPS